MLPLLLSLALQAPESLDSIQVKTADDLDACYAMKPYVLERKGDAANSKHWVDEGEIQLGCTAKAVALAKANPSDKATLLAIAEAVRKGHREEASLKVFRVMVENDKSKASCDESPLFNAILAGLAHPVDYPSKVDSDVSNALAVVDACLAFGQFVTDIKDEVTPEKKRAYVTDNLCGFLKKKKVVGSCP